MQKNTRKRIIVGMICALFVIGIIVILFVYTRNNHKVKESNNDKSNSELNANPTLDPNWPDEKKAIQIILNQGIAKESDLKYIDQTSDNEARIQNLKESSSNKKVYYLVDIENQSYVMSTVVSGGSAS